MTEAGGRPVTRALVSVSDKTGLAPFAAALEKHGVAILSTGGTARALRAAGIAVTDVSAHTGFPEVMDGRVKTLHPMIHGGILARRSDPDDRAALRAHGIAGIDLVAVNLYPFAETVRRGADVEACVEQIDVGGPALIRAAAKNHADVAVVVRPEDYAAVTDDMAALNGATSGALRRRLAATAFAQTAAYDAAIACWFADAAGDPLPAHFVLGGARRAVLRYGENPHQAAALYGDPLAPPGIAQARRLQGKALSYNNLADADAALALVREFARPAAAIVKHANPCGVGLDRTLAVAYGKARACDPVSAFGGVVAVNRPLDGATARAVVGIFTEVAVAPEADAAARAVLAGKPALRVLLTGPPTGLLTGPVGGGRGRAVHALSGGFLVQARDEGGTPDALETVTRRAPTARERADLLFAFAVCKHVKSNAIVYARDGATVGIGAGQASRVDASRIAAWKAAEAAQAAGEARSRAKGAVVASDAFFPFADGLRAAAEAGATAVIQPGGSKRDAEVIAAADEAGLAMVFTGRRHFRH